MESKQSIPTPVAGREAVAHQFYQNLIQLTHEIHLLDQVPEQRQLAKPRQTGIDVYSRAVEIVNAGFDPFIPNPTWHQGFLELNNPPAGISYKIFSWPMPEHAITAYRKAKALGLFDVFTVHSPFPEAFETRYTPLPPPPPIPVLAPREDPVLVGWVNAFIGAKEDGSELTARKKLQDTDMIGFLLADWDLKVDLRLQH